VANPGAWLRGLLRPRLDVFGTVVRSEGNLVRMVSIRLTTRGDRILRATLGLAAATVAFGGSTLWPGHTSTTLLIGSIAFIGAVRTLGTTSVMTDAPLARAAVRAALTEGREHSAQVWRIDGPAAEELGKELVRLQNLWLTGPAAGSIRLDRARATMIANEASPRLSPYLGELSLAEHLAWFAIPAAAQLTVEEPDNLAEYHRDGAAWPSLNTPESSPTWPAMQERDRP
jgi:hypothetical protein